MATAKVSMQDTMNRLFLFLFTCCPCLCLADIKNDDIYIDGPEITLKELWRQIEQHSPYRIREQQISPQQKNKLVRLDGLLPLTTIVEITLSTLGPFHSFKEEGYDLTFIRAKPSAPMAADLPNMMDMPDLAMDLPEISANEITAPPQTATKEQEPPTTSLERESEKPHIKHLSLSDDMTSTPSSPIRRATLRKSTTAPTKETTMATTELPVQEEDKALNEWNRAQSTQIFDDTKAMADAQPNQPLQEQASNKSTQYQLKPGDRIEISVWGEDMTRELIVSPDGRISYILVGVIDVLNMTFLELKSEIETRLSKFLLEPNVTIIGKSYEGNYVSILGAVNQPGRKVVSRSDRVIDVIAKAQGLRYQNFGDRQGEVANLKGAYLSRYGALIAVDFSKLLYEGDMSQNVAVEIGDFIYIPSSVQTPIYVTGEVFQPTSLPYQGNPTLLEAITRANGITTKANSKEICIVQGGIQNPQVRSYNFHDITSGKIQNPLLEPGDIVHVPSTTLTKIERITTQIIPFLDSIIRSGGAKTTVQDW